MWRGDYECIAALISYRGVFLGIKIILFLFLEQ